MTIDASSDSTKPSNSSLHNGILSWIRLLLIDPLAELKSCIIQIVLSLLLLSATQSIFLLLIGPLFKAIFNTPTGGHFLLSSLFPPAVMNIAPDLGRLSLSRGDLARILPLAIFVTAIFKGFAGFVYQNQQQILALHLGRRFRENLFAALLRLPYQRLMERTAGEWMSLIMNDVAWLQMRLSDLLTGLLRDGFMVLASLVALYFIHWPTALILNIAAIPIMIGTGRTGKRIAHFAELWQKELASMVGAVLDLRKRFEFIRAQGGETMEKNRFSQMNQNYYRQIRGSILIRSILAPAIELLGFLLFAGILYAVASKLSGFNVQASQLLQFFAALGILLRPLKSIGEQLAKYHETRGVVRQSLDTFLEVSRQAESEPAKSVRQLTLGDDSREIRIKALAASYKEGFTLKANDLELSAGKAVAVIGPSGSGKSSLIKILAGLLKASDWQATETLSSVTNSATLVSQKPFLFSASIRENLLYGHPTGFDDARLYQELEFVGLRSELAAMDQTLDSPIDFIQTALSGGQMQRLTIARALLREQPLLLMDEVTAAIDPLAEEALTRRLIVRAHAENICLLFVTHRLQQLAYFDEIWFCEAGVLQIYRSVADMMHEPRLVRFIREYSSSNG